MAVKSHTIPRFYLEQFATPRPKNPGRIWVYEKGKAPERRSTRSQGYEKGYFQIVRRNGAKDESMEPTLAKIEDDCNDALAVAKSPLCDLSLIYLKLASYMAMLFHRSTVRRKFSARNWKNLAEPYESLASNENYVQDTAQHYTELLDHPITSEHIRQMIRNQAAMFSDETYTRSTFVKDILMFIEIGKSEMLKKFWQVWHAPEGTEFVTSDNPVVTFVPIFLGKEIWHPGYGFGYKGVIVAFPLAPTACLTMHSTPVPASRGVDHATVLRMNEIVIRSCGRFVYSRTRSDDIAQIVDHLAGTSIPGLNAFMGRQVDQEMVEDHMRKTMRIEKRQ